MKSHKLITIAFVSLSLSIPCTVYSQLQEPEDKNIRIRTIDFLQKNKDTSTKDAVFIGKLKTKNVWARNQYIFKVININTLVYTKVNGKIESKDFNTDQPGILSGIKLPAAITSFITSSDGKKRLKRIVVSHPNEVKDSLLIKLETLADIVEKFTGIKPLNEKLESLKSNVIMTWDSIKAAKFRYVKDLTVLTENVKKDDTLIIYYSDLIDQAEKKLDEIKEIISFITLPPLQGDIIKYTRDSLQKELSLKCIQFCKNTKEYTRIMNSLYTSNDTMNKRRKDIDSIKTLLRKAQEAVDEMKTFKKDGKIKLVQRNYNLLNESNFQYVIDSFDVNKDVHNFIFTAEADSLLPADAPKNRIITQRLITVGSFKIDFSTGLFMNFGNPRFLGPDYYYQNTNDSTREIRQEKGGKKALVSIGALAHIYIRLNSFIKPALSLGVSTTTGFDALNFHGGVSAMLGKPGQGNRLIVTSGVTLREVDLLKNRYKLNEPRQNYPDDIPVTKNFPLAGWFVAITYNLTGGSH